MRSLHISPFCVAFAAGLVVTPFAAAPDRFADVRLKNGLRVLVAEDRSVPVFSIAVTYNVGSRDEQPGRTGFAHLLEHLMFKGSDNVGPGEHFTLIFRNGGSMNGTTNKDRTLYHETLPSNQLDLALFLEADRMRSVAITQENLDNQRSAIHEERLRRYENQPYGHTELALDELAYDTFAYRHPVIGAPGDLDAASVSDVTSFFKTYYAPNNAVLAIVGDVDTADCLVKVRRYFESIPAQRAPLPVDVSEAQQGERRRTIVDPLAPLARVDVAFKGPPAMSADDDALRLLATILGSGRSARLYERMVRGKPLAVTVGAAQGQNDGPSLFRIWATAVSGISAEDLETAIDAEIDSLQTALIGAWELEKARAIERMSLATSKQSSLSRAILLSQYALFHDDPDLINTRLGRAAAVGPHDILRTARRYLVRSNRTVLITRPRAATDQGGV